jgi:murein DD-endopeptidase MepM/ murein hydrolase activator NlpD
MIGFLIRLVSLVFVCVMGWVLGSVYPAPPALIERLNPAAFESRATAGLRSLDVERLRSLLSSERMQKITDAAVEARALAGQVIMVERVDPASEGESDTMYAAAMESLAALSAQGANPAAPVAAPASALVASNSAFETSMFLCPGMTVSNGPRADAQRKVVGYAPVVNVQDVRLAANPTKGACLSSGFGPRKGRTHRGVDFHARDGGPILAAGDGRVIEMKYRDDYGNMILIDHGKGVYTRYAHLSTFQRGLAVGSQVKAGDAIGLMGNTAGYAVPIHLHYEVLTGDYANPKGSFGLAPQNILAAPAAL